MTFCALVFNRTSELFEMGKSSAAKHAANKASAARAKQKRKRNKNKNPEVTHEYATDFPTMPVDAGGFAIHQPPPDMYVTGTKQHVKAAHRARVHGPMKKRLYKHKKGLKLYEMKTVDAEEGGDMYGNRLRFHYPDPFEGLTPFRPKLPKTHQL